MQQTYLVQIFCPWWLLFNPLFLVRFMFFYFWVILIFLSQTHLYKCQNFSVRMPKFLGFCSNFRQTKNFLGCACIPTTLWPLHPSPKVCNLTNHWNVREASWAPVQREAILDPNFEEKTWWYSCNLDVSSW